MTATPAPGPAPTTAPSATPKLVRSPQPRVLGGVAQGLADHLGVPVLWVRLVFVITTLFQLAGVLAYLGFWIFVPLGDRAEAPGLESARRRGLRTESDGRSPSSRDTLQTVALVVIGLGVAWFVWAGSGALAGVLLPLMLGIAGVALIWRQADDRSLQRWVSTTSGWSAMARIVAGGLLVLVGYGVLVAQLGGLSSATQLLAAFVLALLGAALILGPWIVRLVSDLDSERRERVRSQERADVAAHLHDSVLQTLALLQKNASDPSLVATLARRQERELRDWLYGEPPPAEASLRSALGADAADVEATYRVPIEVVGVGDVESSPDVEALRAAAREAMTNAAKHSGADRIDVYVEVGGAEAEVFVRDRGRGFDPEAIPEDRLGIRRSLVERMERHGGRAVVRSGVGEGTEVRLVLPLEGSAEGSRSFAPLTPRPAEDEAPVVESERSEDRDRMDGEAPVVESERSEDRDRTGEDRDPNEGEAR
ncbi:ATP-binding protein [Mumia flava]|uniref:ATP-binding protein n=1 Tax=Mumia flava TaxID=1348852 RepID=UPI001B80B8AE|nr:ATP-binding protein [Mumia flava]